MTQPSPSSSFRHSTPSQPPAHQQHLRLVSEENQRQRAQHQAEVEALIAEAEADPKAYRRKIIRWIALGYGVVGFTFVVAVAILALVGGAVFWMFASGRFHVGGIKILLYLGLPGLLLVWAILRALLARYPAPQGRYLSPVEAPKLFSTIEALRSEAGVKPLKAVVITDDINAAVMERPRLGMLPWFSRYLILGLPLMQGLSAEELRSVIGHEFGHLSAAHGQLGSFVYRVRRVWLRLYEDALRGDLAGGRILGRFIAWYVPRFDNISFAIARSKEYEADATAAALTSKEAAGSALTRMELLLEEQTLFYEDLRKANQGGAALPVDLHEQLGARLAQAAQHEKASDWYALSLTRATGTDDTHPALCDRLRGLGVEPSQPAPMSQTAAQELLGPMEQQLNHEFSAVWQQGAREAWSHIQEAAARSAEELAMLDGKPELSSDERLQQAGLCLHLGQSERCQAICDALLLEEPNNASALYLWGEGALEQQDPSGVSRLERAMKLDPFLVESAAPTLYQWHAARGEWDRAERVRHELEDHQSLIAKAQHERSFFEKDDEALPPNNPTLAEHLRDAIALQPRLKEAFFFQKKLEFFPDKPFWICAVVIKKKFTDHEGSDFFEIMQALADSVDSPDPLLVVCANDWPKRRRKDLRSLPGADLMAA